MTAAVQLEIQGDSGNFTFAVEGAFFPRLEAEYKLAANPPQIVGLREVWEVRGARIVSADGTVASTWSQWVAFRDRIAVRGASHPTYARFVIPGGATLHTLGPTTHEDFQVEAIEGEQDDVAPGASWRTVAPVTLRISGVQRFADTNGIVGWEQEVTNSYPDGRHLLEWRTTITTAEGTSAVTKAQSYAAIDSSALGSTYLYETNGSDGIDYTTPDSDEQNSRTPTICVAVSRVRSYGVTIGSVDPGSSPSEVAYAITTRTSATEQVTITTASATGPNALQFVEGKAPVVWSEAEIVDEQARMVASGTWTHRTSKTGAEPTTPLVQTIRVQITGGGRAVDFEAVADAGEPVQFVGAFLPATAVVEIERNRIGGEGRLEDLKLPGLPSDWVLDTSATTESEPFVAEAGESSDQHRWSRVARLTLRAAKVQPGKSITLSMSKAQEVTSYLGS